MNDLEFNKICAAVLVAGIVASLSGFVAMKLTASEPLKQNAYKIEGVASSGGGEAAPEKPQPILDLIASADAAKGQQIAKVCASCHNLEKGGPNGAMAPNLAGVVGRAKGSHPGFEYSDAMKKKGGDWTYEDLNQFLWKPQGFVSGTKMTFAGLKKPEERAAVIAYLRSLSDSPPALPAQDEIAKEKAELAPPEAAAPAAKAAAPAEQPKDAPKK
jgi:cytochrome c